MRSMPIHSEPEPTCLRPVTTVPCSLYTTSPAALLAFLWLMAIATTLSIALSAKVVADLLPWHDALVWWFLPAVIGGTIAANILLVFMVGRLWRRRQDLRFERNAWAWTIWIMLALSFICTAAVHSFYPFRLSLPLDFEVTTALKVNFAIAIAGVLFTIVLAVAYRAGHSVLAITAIPALALLLLVPNDDCPNMFNLWWIRLLGASPLMYIPNLWALQLGACGLCGIHTRLNTLFVGCVCVATLALGIGHHTGIFGGW